jgi:hypothetical protein
MTIRKTSEEEEGERRPALRESIGLLCTSPTKASNISRRGFEVSVSCDCG